MAAEREGEEEAYAQTPTMHSPKGCEDGWQKSREKVRKTAVLSFFRTHVCKLEESVRGGDDAGFYRHLKTMNLEGS